MRVGVIDVGSNTVRLLVASVAGDTVRTLREERVHLGLGEEILHYDRVRRRKLDEVREVTGEYARIARKLGVRELETVVTAPGRQGDSPERLIDAIRQATGAEVRVVSAEDEGRLAFTGAVSRANPGEGVVAVCDVGGGSTEVVVGTELLGPAWVRSVDLGSLRLTAALFPSDPPTAAEIDAARRGCAHRAGRARAAATGDCTRHGRQRACSRTRDRPRVRASRARKHRRRPGKQAGSRVGGRARSPTHPRPHAPRRRTDPRRGLAAARAAVHPVTRRDSRRCRAPAREPAAPRPPRSASSRTRSRS